METDYSFVLLSWIFMALSVAFCWGFHIFVQRAGRTPEEKSLSLFWRIVGVASVLGFSFVHLLIRRWTPGPIPTLLRPIIVPWLFVAGAYGISMLAIRRFSTKPQAKLIALDIFLVVANAVALLT